MTGARRPRGAAVRAAPPASRPPKGAESAGRSAFGWLAGAVALAALAWACRGAPLGTPAADDYDYLYALRFERPLNLLGPMGSSWYWRPLSRQLYFALFGRSMLDAPWAIPVAHGALLLALFVLAYRTARRALPPWTAAAIATFPLLAVPARALLGWPTGAQPLLAMVFAAAAVHEAAARRLPSALAALLLALLSHAQAVLAVPALPVAAWLATRDRRVGARAAAGAVAVALGFLGLSAIARAHGAGLPPRVGLGEAMNALGPLLARSGRIQLGLEDLGPGAREAIAWLEAALAAVTVGAFARPGPRARLVARLPVIGLGLGLFIVGIAFLSFSPALFTPRHTCLPSLGLAASVGLVAGAASEGFAAAWIALRLVALLAAPAAPGALAADLPGGLSPMSFREIARLQATAGSAREALLAAYPRLPKGATVRYWSLPRASEIAFAGARAVRVWYGDSTLAWTFWDRDRTPPEADPPPTLAFNLDRARPAVVMRPQAVRRYEEGMADLGGERLADADRAFADAALAQEPRVDNFATEIVRLRARIALERGDLARADSLNELDRAWSGEGASWHELRAVLSWRAGDRDGAAAHAHACLALLPGDAIAQAILDSVSLGVGGATTPRTEPGPGSPTPR